MMVQCVCDSEEMAITEGCGEVMYLRKTRTIVFVWQAQFAFWGDIFVKSPMYVMTNGTNLLFTYNNTPSVLGMKMIHTVWPDLLTHIFQAYKEMFQRTGKQKRTLVNDAIQHAPLSTTEGQFLVERDC